METDLKIGDGDHTVIEYRHALLQRISPYLRGLDGLVDTAAKRRVRWTPRAAGLAAVLMTLDAGCTLNVRCADALACMGDDFARRRRVGKTYNGLVKALVRQGPTVLPLLKSDLRRQALEAMGKVRKVAGWSLLAADGSKEDLPRTRGLEEEFGIADNGKYPQALVTAIVEVFTGLPWDWRIGKGRGSEKGDLMDMAGQLPAGSLLLADGNFVGHGLWSALDKAGKRFLIRVGGNVSLIRKLLPDARTQVRGGVVYAWPVHQQKEVPPLKLRLIKVKGGKDPVYLLTNVMDRRRLRDSAAGKIYRLRWGVELFYRTLKRTLGYAKLHSRSGPRAKVELEWGLVTLCVLAMLGIDRLHRRKIDPRRFSPASLLTTLRRAMLRGANPRRRRSASRDLDRDIGRAFRDAYTRRAPKRSRHRPVTHNTPSPQHLKPPRVRNATAHERRLAIQTHTLRAA